jgi:hypothetical protein
MKPNICLGIIIGGHYPKPIKLWHRTLLPFVKLEHSWCNMTDVWPFVTAFMQCAPVICVNLIFKIDHHYVLKQFTTESSLGVFFCYTPKKNMRIMLCTRSSVRLLTGFAFSLYLNFEPV